MKKHLVTFLSIIGLAGPATPVQAQVLKGSGQQSKAENQIKQNKQKHEANAVQKIRDVKNTQGNSAGSVAKSQAHLKRGITADAAKKNVTTAQRQIKVTDKSAKADAAQNSVQSDLQKKIVKTKTGVKGESQNPN